MRSIGDKDQSSVRLIRQDTSSYSGELNESLIMLEHRLNDGYARIEQALAQGQDVTAWEDFWIDLLHQYEAAMDSVPVAA